MIKCQNQPVLTTCATDRPNLARFLDLPDASPDSRMSWESWNGTCLSDAWFFCGFWILEYASGPTPDDEVWSEGGWRVREAGFTHNVCGQHTPEVSRFTPGALCQRQAHTVRLAARFERNHGQDLQRQYGRHFADHFRALEGYRLQALWLPEHHCASQGSIGSRSIYGVTRCEWTPEQGAFPTPQPYSECLVGDQARKGA